MKLGFRAQLQRLDEPRLGLKAAAYPRPARPGRRRYLRNTSLILDDPVFEPKTCEEAAVLFGLERLAADQSLAAAILDCLRQGPCSQNHENELWPQGSRSHPRSDPQLTKSGNRRCVNPGVALTGETGCRSTTAMRVAHIAQWAAGIPRTAVDLDS